MILERKLGASKYLTLATLLSSLVARLCGTFRKQCWPLTFSNLVAPKGAVGLYGHRHQLCSVRRLRGLYSMHRKAPSAR